MGNSARGKRRVHFDPDNVEFAVEQCSELLIGGAPGLHFYTLNKVNPTQDILNRIKR